MPNTKTISWPAITAIVPITDNTGFEAEALDSAVEEFQTQAMGSVCGNFFRIDSRMMTPNAQDRMRLASMRPCLSQRITQSRWKSATSARIVARWVVVESRESIQIIKKWKGTMELILARPTDWMPIPVMICWSERASKNLRGIFQGSNDGESSRKMISALRARAMKAVMIKERRTCENPLVYEF